MNIFLKKFSKNVFDPLINNETDIPDEPGNYIICLKKYSKFPKTTVKPVFKTYNGLKVIYTGIAGTSLRKRDYHQHFTKNNAGSSTLRKSLGSLFGYNKIPRDKITTNNKTKFNDEDEIQLSDWMRNNLIMFYYANADYYLNEDLLITHFAPPLNIDKNVSSEFRTHLKFLRSDKFGQHKSRTRRLKSNSDNLLLLYSKSNKKYKQQVVNEQPFNSDGCLKIILLIAAITLFLYIISHIN